MNAQPLPGPYRPDGNYIHFDTPDAGLPTLLARLYDTSDRSPEALVATTRLMAASWEMYQALLAEDDFNMRVAAVTSSMDAGDPASSWQPALEELTALAKGVTRLRRDALAKAQGRPVNIAT